MCPVYICLALLVGTFWITRRMVNALRWAIEERTPTREDQLNTFLAPWRVAQAHLVLWGVGTALLTTLYGLQDTTFIPRFLFTISFAGIVVVGRLLPAHRIRAAAGGGTGARSGPAAASLRRRNHGPH